MRLPAWAALLLLPLVPWLQTRVDAGRAPVEHRALAAGLWSARDVRRVAPGFDLLMADLYWLRTVQYFGSQRVFAGGSSYELLLPLVNVTTDLDPRLEIAYRYGAIFLGDPSGANQPDLALRLLRKGVRNNPGSWRMYQDYGFYTFLYKHDARRAAEILTEARKVPGAPIWLEALAASVLRRGGERALSREMWRHLHDQEQVPVMRQTALRHLMNLDALDLVDAYSAGVRAWKQGRGTFPPSLDAVQAAAKMPQPPVDPSGVRLRYDASTGEVSLAPDSKAIIY